MPGRANVYDGTIWPWGPGVIFRVSTPLPEALPAPPIKAAITYRRINRRLAIGEFDNMDAYRDFIKRTITAHEPAELSPFLDDVAVFDYWPDRQRFMIGKGTVLGRQWIIHISDWREESTTHH